jgi:Spore Coat Protein U domain
MKKILIAAAIASTLGVSTSAVAAGTQTMSVTATVSPKCSFTTTSTTMDFGTIDPSIVAANVTSTGGTLSYKCTNKTTPTSITVTADANGTAAAPLLKSGVDTLAFSVAVPALTAGTGFGAAAAQTVTITGTITLANAQAAAAGTYTDTLTFTIAP